MPAMAISEKSKYASKILRVDTTCALRNPVPGQSPERGVDMGELGILCLIMYLSHDPMMAER